MDTPGRRCVRARASTRSREPAPWRAGPARAAARSRHLHGAARTRVQIIAGHYPQVRPRTVDKCRHGGVTRQVTTASAARGLLRSGRRETCRTRYVMLLTYT